MMQRKNQLLTNKIYSSYQEALGLCNDGLGYSTLELTEVVVKKNLKYRELITHNDFLSSDVTRTLLALGPALNSKSFRVLDFGGGGGYHYTLARHVLEDNCDIKWNIVETDSMCQSGVAIADNSLKFFNDIDKAVADLGFVDLILSSSALQYCPDPMESLEKLLSVSAKYIYITRTPFFSGKNKLISIQSSMLSHNGPGELPSGFEDQEILYPISFIPLNQVEKAIKEKYKIRFKVAEDFANLFIEDQPVNSYYGFFCELK
jgi:putative methyltransferase (TIGR04325 family)